MVITGLGNFEVTSGKVVIGDPCYGHRKTEEEWLKENLLFIEAQNGFWSATMKSGVRSLSNRVFELLAYTGELDESLPWLDLGMIDVDTGQAGIFDYAYFQNDSDLEYDPDLNDFHTFSKFYQNCCAKSLNKPHGGVLKHGVISSTGFGDGAYDMLGQFKEGKLVAVKAEYIEVVFSNELQVEADQDAEKKEKEFKEKSESLLTRVNELLASDKLNESNRKYLEYNLRVYDMYDTKVDWDKRVFTKQESLDDFFRMLEYILDEEIGKINE